MKELWLDEDKCTGCGMCADVCPVSAIKMESGPGGFKFPKIHESCIDCGLCEKRCMDSKRLVCGNYTRPRTYAAWSLDGDIRSRSTSGGAFSELAKVVLGEGGSVAGARYTDRNMVEHTLVSSEKGLEDIRQSKYVQSDGNGIYRRIKERLDYGEKVLFCGTPCQVAALYAYLGARDAEGLTTIDLICRGVNSPKAYRAWLDEIETDEHSRVTKVWFKYKVGGWKSSPRRTRIDLEDGRYKILEGDKNLYMHGYLTSNLYIRPCCGGCAYKGAPRQGDITLADFWGIEGSLDDDRGTSLVLLNSKKGEILFDKARNGSIVYERSFEEILAGNSCFDRSVKVPKESRDFLDDLDRMEFSAALKKYTKVSLWEKIKQKLSCGRQN